MSCVGDRAVRHRVRLACNGQENINSRDLRGGGGSICLMILNEVFLVTRSCSKGFGLGCENPVPEPFRPRLLGEITQPQALL